VIRAAVYLLASGAVWTVEGVLFSRLLGFSTWQMIVMAVMYALLFTAACVLLYRFSKRFRVAEGGLALWRLLSLAPMLVIVVGSFVSLPLLLLIALLGRWL
jgi:hypothetical protein